MSTPRVAVTYFSQTGNTEKVARQIAAGLVQSGAQADVLDMLKTEPSVLAGYDVIGIGAPCFYFREPVIVERFIKRMHHGAGKPAFIFLTSGGHPGNSFYHMSRNLSRRGFVVTDAYGCHGYDTYPPFKGKGRYIGHPDEDELAGAKTFGELLVERSRKNEDLSPVFKRQWDRFGRLALIFRSRSLSWLILPRKRVLAGKCTKCGLCASHCPVSVIDLPKQSGSVGTPVFKRGCIDCYMCERVCPEDAIRCNWTFISKQMNVEQKESGNDK